MKNCGWLLLTMVMLLAGCAPGYSERPVSGDFTPGYYEPKGWYQNPETEEEQAQRIWREDSQR